MISGLVHSNGDAIVEIKVRGPRGTAKVPVVVDTGFSDTPALPSAIVEALGLPARDSARMTLADGSIGEGRLYAAEVEWFDRIEPVLAVQINGAALIGMTMLLECRLEIEVEPGGRVAIDRMR